MRAAAVFLALLFALSARASGVYDARLYSQIRFHDIDDSNRERYLADVRASGVEAVLISFCDCFEQGERRKALFSRLAAELRFFETNGVPALVWINGFGYGNERGGAAAERLAGSARLTNFAGETCGAACPTGPAIREALRENVRNCALAGAQLILMDDDFVQSVRPGLGCTCKNHLALVSERVGRTVSREEVRDSFTGGPNAVRSAFLDVCGEVATELARELRRTLDETRPGTGLGLCASYTHYDAEGTDIKTLLAAFAGKERPFFRISGAPYWATGDKSRYDGAGLDGILEFVRMQTAWFRNCGFPVLDENDPYPRKATLVPPWLCELYDKATIAEGALRRHKYFLCYGADRSEPGYLDAHLADMPDDARLRRIFAGTESCGVRVIFPQHQLRDAELPSPYIGDRKMQWLFSHPIAAHFLARNGIPCRHEGSGPYIAFGAAAVGLGADAAREGAILDRAAAKILAARGVDVKGSGFYVLDFDGADLDFGTYPAGKHREEILSALARWNGGRSPVHVATSAARVYQIVRRNPIDGSYSALIENLDDAPANATIVVPGGAGIAEYLRGDFSAGADGVVLKNLAPHSYAAVKFRCNLEGK